MVALCHFYESTYYAGSYARIIAASLRIYVYAACGIYGFAGCGISVAVGSGIYIFAGYGPSPCARSTLAAAWLFMVPALQGLYMFVI